MSVDRLAKNLIAARTVRERRRLVSLIDADRAAEAAIAVKTVCFGLWTSEPATARRAAAALAEICRRFPDDRIRAYSDWVAGIAAITSGRLDTAIERLSDAFRRFQSSNQPIEAAGTQVAKLIPLALLGRYDEAIATGLAALRTFDDAGDDQAAGKVEKNLGNIVSRFGRESEAEKYYLSARTRFERLGDSIELTMADNSLGNTYAELDDFVSAEHYYESALRTAKAGGMTVTEAEIEASMGRLSLFRGKYDAALRLLEQSRQTYDRLSMPHQKAIAELEIADTYLELNLMEEARSILGRAAGTLKRLKLRSEEARARLNLGRAASALGDRRTARIALERAAANFRAEGDPNGTAAAQLAIAELAIAAKDPKRATSAILAAERALKRSENVRRKALVQIAKGETLILEGKRGAARKAFAAALEFAESFEQRNLAIKCLQAIGDTTADRGEATTAYKRAISLIESLRAPLPAEEFRRAFLADKLAPYYSLAEIAIDSGDPSQALRTIEDARARTLFESLFDRKPAETGPTGLGDELAKIREELNWFYSRADREGASAALQSEIARRERRIETLQRRIGSTRTGSATEVPKLNTDAVRRNLGANRAIVEFVEFDDGIGAFVVTSDEIAFFPALAGRESIHRDIEGLQFQFGALRYGTGHLQPFLENLKSRADHYLRSLHRLLLEPITTAIGMRDLVIVPTGPLNYVPFAALRSDRSYLIEDREIVVVPSVSVWMHLNEKKNPKPRNALLVGVADERIPLVGSEIDAVGECLGESLKLTGEAATFSRFAAERTKFDIIHLACHGRFRPDNPLFSSISLADGQVTVRDLCDARIKASIVTLSACETGVSKVAPGEEILGLARGFLSAGATNLVISLWTVNDAATSKLMSDFYRYASNGIKPSAALRKAQLALLESHRHPYFWSPFVIIGK